jgi:hypothetical protein
MNIKTLYKAYETLTTADLEEKAVSIPKLKKLIFQEIGKDQVSIQNKSDYFAWVNAAKKHFNQVSPLTFDEWQKIRRMDFCELRYVAYSMGITKEELHKFGSTLDEKSYEKAIVSAIQLNTSKKQVLMEAFKNDQSV